MDREAGNEVVVTVSETRRSTRDDVDTVVPIGNIPSGNPNEARLSVSPLSLEFTGIRSWVPNLALGGQKDAKEAPKKRQILFDISGGVQPGEVLALMGPSGSGKTSLLSILGNRTQKGITLGGSITFNGRKPTSNLKRKIGFVEQDDLMFGSLTVWETLWYAAQLRLPSEMSDEERAERVQTVITTLGLDRCRDTIIGGPFQRGVSGGERKRVSVGHEMIINPAALFLDEPTSGLDSTTALSLVGTLRDLASAGRTIVTTIHQPSSRMYMQLDKLMLLSNGHTMYYGNAQEAGAWFEWLGSPCPFGVNLADHILDMASGNDIGKSAEDKEKKRLKQIEAYRDRQLSEDFDIMTGIAGMSSDAEFIKKPSLTYMSVCDSRDQLIDGCDENAKKTWAANWTKQVRVLASRTFKVSRFDRVNAQTVSQVTLIALITGLLWWQSASGETVQAARDTSGLLFFQMLFPAYSALFSAIFVFPSEMMHLRKERASGMYRISAYYFAKALSDLPLDLLLPTLSTIIVYFMTGLRLQPWYAFFANWLSVLLLILTSQGFGLMLGAGFRNPKNAQTVATVSMIGLMLLGGFYVQNLPVWITWVKYLSWIYYSYNILTHIEFQGRQFYDCSGPDGACEPVGWEAIGLPKDPNESVALDIGVLCIMFLALRIAVYFVLAAKTKAPKALQ